MTRSLKVLKKDAEQAKQWLLQHNLLDTNYSPLAEEAWLYFPIKKKEINLSFSAEIVEKDLPQRKKQGDYKAAIKALLTEEERAYLKTAFDIVGDIAILEIDPILEPKEKAIAEIILQYHKNIKTVLKKAGIHDGTFRTQKMTYLAGEEKKVTIHKENGVRLKVNVEEVYFSPRLSTERKRILQQIKDNEEILCMFSGVGPYPLVFLKNKPTIKHIDSIEINPLGIALQKENILLNKLPQEKITVYEGDVRAIVPKLHKKYDRITMPLPKDADDFLDVALQAAKQSTIIHLYDFVHEENFKKREQEVLQEVESLGKKTELLQMVKCGQYAPREYRICWDITLA